MHPAKRWNLLVWLLPLAALVGLITWRILQKQAVAAGDAKAAAAKKNAPLNVDTAPVTRRTLVQNFTVVGSIEAPATVQIAPKVTGLLTTLSVREGDRVKAGQVVGQIDPRETIASLRQKEAALAAAKFRLAQAQATQNAQTVGVSSDIAKQQAALATARAQNTQAKADFSAAVATAEANVAAAKERVASANADIANADTAIASAKASVDNAQATYTRQASLLAKGYVAQQAVDNYQTAVTVAEAALKAAQSRRDSLVSTRDAVLASQKAAEKQAVIARNKAKADVAVADATLAQGRAGLRVSQANTAQNEAYVQNLAALQAAVTSAEADVQSAQVLLSQASLLSPLEGVVTTRLIEPGAIVSPTTPVISVQSVRRVWATVAAPEETARFLTQGQSATVTLDALPGETFTGKIAQVLPSADPQSRQFTVRVALDNPQFRLRPGTFARVNFVTGKQPNVLTVPPEAVKTDPADPNAQYVFIVGADNTAQKRVVTTGNSDARGIAVKSDTLKEGDPVIILSQRDVKEGQAVRVGGGKDAGGKNAGSAGGKDGTTSPTAPASNGKENTK